MSRLVTSAVTAAVTLLLAGTVEAAPPFVEREMTLPRHDFAGDIGLGIGHNWYRPAPYDRDLTGVGLNLEGAFAVAEHVELGLRTGLRFGTDGRATQADTYGRTLWTETWGTNYDAVANPEFRVRWAFYTGDVVEVGLDGRAYLPIEAGSRVGIMAGLPLAFHIGTFARIDTGVYVPIVFYSPETFTAISVPAYVWFQASDKVWLGPMSSLRFVDYGPGPRNTEFLLGFGLGIQVARAVDLKTNILFPHITETAGARTFGAGFGVQFRIE